MGVKCATAISWSDVTGTLVISVMPKMAARMCSPHTFTSQLDGSFSFQQSIKCRQHVIAKPTETSVLGLHLQGILGGAPLWLSGCKDHEDGR